LIPEAVDPVAGPYPVPDERTTGEEERERERRLREYLQRDDEHRPGREFLRVVGTGYVVVVVLLPVAVILMILGWAVARGLGVAPPLPW
jgi:hypothetical protein